MPICKRKKLLLIIKFKKVLLIIIIAQYFKLKMVEINAKDISYKNPEYALEIRPYYSTRSPEYLMIREILHLEVCQKNNPTFYCPIHNSVETRSSIDHHKLPANDQKAC